MGLEGSGWRLSEARGRRRYTKVLVLQECFHSRYALGIVALLAIKTRSDSRVIPGTIGILATTCAVVIEVGDELSATCLEIRRRWGGGRVRVLGRGGVHDARSQDNGKRDG
jgi:hypothetical protein